MAFMKRDVNLGLLVIIIAIILLFTGFSVYYQYAFKGISEDFNDKTAQLDQVKIELEQQREQLNETYSLRIRAEKDRTALDEKYRDLNSERDQLASDKSSLESELASTKSSLSQKSSELTATQNKLSDVEANLAATNSELSTLESRFNALRNDFDEVCDDYSSVTGGNTHSEC